MIGSRLLFLTSTYQVCALLVATAVVALLWSEGALGLGLGGILMAANFRLMIAFGARAVRPGRGQLAFGLALAVKMVVMMAAIAALLSWFEAHALAFVAGMSTLFVGIGLAMVHTTVVAHDAANPY